MHRHRHHRILHQCWNGITNSVLHNGRIPAVHPARIEFVKGNDGKLGHGCFPNAKRGGVVFRQISASVNAVSLDQAVAIANSAEEEALADRRKSWQIALTQAGFFRRHPALASGSSAHQFQYEILGLYDCRANRRQMAGIIGICFKSFGMFDHTKRPTAEAALLSLCAKSPNALPRAVAISCSARAACLANSSESHLPGPCRPWSEPPDVPDRLDFLSSCGLRFQRRSFECNTCGCHDRFYLLLPDPLRNGLHLTASG